MQRSPMNRTPGRRAGALTSVTIAVAIVALGWFLWLLEEEVDAADFTRVETSLSRVDAGAGWFDPRWEGMVRERIAGVTPFACDDSEGLEQIAQALRTLPFVRSLSQPEVLWPDGVRVSLVLRAPIACVKIGREYLPIANDGVLLAGSWPAPPRCGQGFLPEIALEPESGQNLRVGQVLWNDAVADALSVASSMWSELENEDLARLGRSIIDARKARHASAVEPGTVIYLEDSRRVLFGRAPSTQEPGELPVEAKWLNLANALLCLPAGPPLEAGGPPTARPDDVDWELVEVRWDHPAMLPRGASANARVPVKSVKTARAKPAGTESAPSTKLGRVH